MLAIYCVLRTVCRNVVPEPGCRESRQPLDLNEGGGISRRQQTHYTSPMHTCHDRSRGGRPLYTPAGQRKKERDRAKREKVRARLQNEGRHTWGPKERRKAYRSVPSQRHHSGDATRNRESDRERERERETRENEREREREREKERKSSRERERRVLVCGSGVLISIRCAWAVVKTTGRRGCAGTDWGSERGGVDLSIFHCDIAHKFSATFTVSIRMNDILSVTRPSSTLPRITTRPLRFFLALTPRRVP